MAAVAAVNAGPQAVALETLLTAGCVLLILAILVRVFPEFLGKALFRWVENRSERHLHEFKDKINHDSSAKIEQLKAELQSSFSHIKTSVDFIGAAQAGLRNEATDAVKLLWKRHREINSDLAGVAFFEGILTDKEKSEFFGGESIGKIGAAVENLRTRQNFDALAQRHVISSEVDDCRIFVSDKLWQIFHLSQTMRLRSAFLISLSFQGKIYKPWKSDELFVGHLKSYFGEREISTAKLAVAGGLDALFARLDADFVHECRRIVSGSVAIADSLSDMRAVLAAEAREIAAERDTRQHSAHASPK